MKVNPLRDVLVYEPHGFTSKDPLPCLIHMPGYGSSPQRWMQKDMPMHRLMDLLILEGRIPACRVVCIDGSTPLGGSQYVDSELNGPFAQHIIQEILPWIASQYQVDGPFKLCGHSSGGFAALHLSSLYPKCFDKVASFGGDLYFELTHKNMIAELINTFRKGNYGQSMKDCLQRNTFSYILGLCAAYSPNLSQKKWWVDFPIDMETTLIDENIWKRWLSFDPLCWNKTRLKKLKQMDLVYLCAGAEDQFQLHLGAEAFHLRCQSMGISSQLQIIEGNHSLSVRQMEAGLIALFG